MLRIVLRVVLSVSLVAVVCSSVGVCGVAGVLCCVWCWFWCCFEARPDFKAFYGVGFGGVVLKYATVLVLQMHCGGVVWSIVV